MNCLHLQQQTADGLQRGQLLLCEIRFPRKILVTEAMDRESHRGVSLRKIPYPPEVSRAVDVLSAPASLSSLVILGERERQIKMLHSRESLRKQQLRMLT